MSDSARSVQQDGLEWAPGLLGLTPRWAKEPDTTVIESLARRHLGGLDSDAKWKVNFYAQGAFNKLYTVDTGSRTVLMRVSLPVDPHHKTTSEVSAIEYVRLRTEINVPRVFAFDASSENELGFEWILMEMVPGKALRKAWRKLPMDAKDSVVRQLVCCQAKLFDHRFERIGGIYQTAPSRYAEVSNNIATTATIGENTGQFNVGRMVSHIFFWGDHLVRDDDVPRGPFLSSHDWLHARLVITLRDQDRIISDSTDEDELEDASEVKDIVQKLLEILPSIFPRSDSPEPTVLHHDDLSMQNILVDDAGKITAIVDWECVSALPPWRACQIPDFLEGRDRNEQPRRADYAPDQPETSNEYERPPDALDNEGVNSLYWEHLLEYEQTQLRRLFMAEMARVQPDWVAEATSKQAMLKADFEAAVHNADNGFCFKIIREWIGLYVAEEETWSLRRHMLE